MMEGTSLESHLTAFKNIMAELEALDANTLMEEDLCSLLLVSVPLSFSGFQVFRVFYFVGLKVYPFRPFMKFSQAKKS